MKLFQKPEKDEWGSPLKALQAALSLEKMTNQALLEVHALSTHHTDPQVRLIFAYRAESLS